MHTEHVEENCLLVFPKHHEIFLFKELFNFLGTVSI